MIDPTKQLVKDISSSINKADTAKFNGDAIDELKYRIFTMHDIATILLRYLDGRIDRPCAESYATSLPEIADRINDIFETEIAYEV